MLISRMQYCTDATALKRRVHMLDQVDIVGEDRGGLLTLHDSATFVSVVLAKPQRLLDGLQQLDSLLSL